MVKPSCFFRLYTDILSSKLQTEQFNSLTFGVVHAANLTTFAVTTVLHFTSLHQPS